MMTIAIQADEDLVAALQQIAEQKATTLDAAAKEALRDYFRARPAPSRTYSFIGLGRSGKGNLSKQAESILDPLTAISEE